MDLALILFLVLLNGLFAMSEMAVVSSRRARLQSMADEGTPGANAALALHSEPSRFLSTIQVGITTIGILSGAVGETALADPLAEWLAGYPAVAPYGRAIALALAVAALTYFSVVIGELVPKRLALLAPESAASLIARPMAWLSGAATPLVAVLSASGDLVLRVLGASRREQPPVTNEEIKVLMEQGAEAGVFHESEQEIVSNVLRLDEQRLGAIMTPRMDIYAVDLGDSEESVRQQIIDSPFGRIVVCRDGLDHILGVLETGDLIKRAVAGRPVTRADIEAVLRPPLYVPESVTTTRLLENFRGTRVQFALIVDEYGELQGLVTLNDVLTSIVGQLQTPTKPEEQDIVRRDDGSWLVDGSVAVERFKAVLDVSDDLPGEEEHAFHTLGGFVMHMLGRVPKVADHFDSVGLHFEIVDMDKNRVDKVLVSRSAEVPGEAAESA